MAVRWRPLQIAPVTFPLWVSDEFVRPLSRQRWIGLSTVAADTTSRCQARAIHQRYALAWFAAEAHAWRRDRIADKFDALGFENGFDAGQGTRAADRDTRHAFKTLNRLPCDPRLRCQLRSGDAK